MKLVVRVKLLPSPEQAKALQATLRACNEAAEYASQVAQATGARTKYALQEAVHHELKARFGLSAQPTVRVLGKVCDAYTSRQANLKAGNLGRKGSARRQWVESTPISFRLDADQPFDDRCLSWQMDARTVSIWTVAGRMKNLGFVASPERLKLLAEYRQGESDLLCQGGQWFLAATCEVPERVENPDPVGFVGVDLGIVEIATTSTGDRFTGRVLNRYRRKQNRLRAKLQAKGTKSAKRVLKCLRRREARRARDVNHTISKRIVERAERTDHGIVLEDLRGIRGVSRSCGTSLPIRLAGWGWWIRPTPPRPARSAITPADATGPAGTGSSAEAVVLHADVNASRNLAHRGEVAWTAGRQSTAPAPCLAGVQ